MRTNIFLNSPAARLSRVVFLALLAMASLVRAQDFPGAIFGAYKTLFYTQTSATDVVPAALPLAPPAFWAGVLPGPASGSVQPPSGAARPVSAGARAVSITYANQAALDAANPGGGYTLTGGGLTAPLSLTLPASATYPEDIPRVIGGSWTGGRLMIDATQDHTVNLAPFSQWGATGIYTTGSWLLETSTSSSVLLSSRGTFTPGDVPLNRFTIPAGYLTPGANYRLVVQYSITWDVNKTASPGAWAMATTATGLAVNISAVAPAATAPVITSQPVSQTITPGSTVVFQVGASATPAATYQWRRGSADIAGATSAMLVLSGASAIAGGYTCVVSNSSGSVTSTPATLSVSNVAAAEVGRLVNFSVRAHCGTGEQALLVGFATGGAGTIGAVPLLVRSAGPSLNQFGLTGTLADPLLTIAQGGAIIATNDNWAGEASLLARTAQVGAFSFASPASLDAAQAFSPAAGACTVQVAGKNGGTGLALAEIYDATPADAFTANSPRLINVSARAPVGVGSGVLIGGFVIGGTTAKTVLIRGVAGALGAFGVTGKRLIDPILQLYSRNALLRENNNWGGNVPPARGGADAQIAAVAASVGAFPFETSSGGDSAILVTLAPGAYSAQLAGLNLDQGNGLLEIYEVP